MSDRALKVLTTVLLLVGLCLMLGWPAMLHNLPQGGHLSLLARKQILVRYTLYFSLLVIDFFATMVCAWVLVRRARAQAIEDSKENLRLLIEGTLHDHKNKQNPSGQP